MAAKPHIKNLGVIALVLLHLLLSVSAMYGGLLLCIDPSGGLIKMPVTLLAHTPFRNFQIPGLILLITLGVLPILIVYGLIWRPQWKLLNLPNVYSNKYWAWTYSLYVGFALLIWITVQLYLIRQFDMLHVICLAWGVFIQIVTLLPSVQKWYKS